MMRHHTPDEIRTRAIQAAIKKYDEGCTNCSAAYLKLAQSNGATEADIRRAGISRRGFMRFAALTLAAGTGVLAAGSLFEVKTAQAAVVQTLNVTITGSFGVDSCTPPDVAPTQNMPLQFYIAELGGTNNSVGCFIPETSAGRRGLYPRLLGAQRSQSLYRGIAVCLWATTGAGGGSRLAEHSRRSRSHTSSPMSRTVFGGWGGDATQKDMAAVLDGFLTGVADAQYVPGVYIASSRRDTWFPSTYLPAVPFVYWVAGGPYAGAMCAPCTPDCDTLTPVYRHLE